MLISKFPHKYFLTTGLGVYLLATVVKAHRKNKTNGKK